MSLTDVAIRQAKPKAKGYKLYDSNGLYLFITPKGKKIWRMRYKWAGKEKVRVLGHYPAMSLKEARSRRDEAKDLIQTGLDPAIGMKARRQGAGADSFETIAREWLDKQKGVWTEGYFTKIERRLEKYVFPLLGNRRARDVKPADLLEVLHAVEKLGLNESAHRIRQDCRQIFDLAILTGRAEVNPASSLGKALAPLSTRHRAAITDRKEIGALLRAIDGYEGQPVTRIALQLLALTFVRPGELRLACWSEFDLAAREWRIPAERMKMKDEHVVPLSRQAMALLEELAVFSRAPGIMFPGLQRGRPIGENTLNAALRRIGYDGGTMVPHGFRSMASTLLNEAGWGADIIERQLAHRERNKVRAAYNRAQYLSERRKMMQYWADWLDAMRAGKTGIPERP